MLFLQLSPFSVTLWFLQKKNLVRFPNFSRNIIIFSNQCNKFTRWQCDPLDSPVCQCIPRSKGGCVERCVRGWWSGLWASAEGTPAAPLCCWAGRAFLLKSLKIIWIPQIQEAYFQRGTWMSLQPQTGATEGETLTHMITHTHTHTHRGGNRERERERERERDEDSLYRYYYYYYYYYY